jgi:hypothetical protein
MPKFAVQVRVDTDQGWSGTIYIVDGFDHREAEHKARERYASEIGLSSDRIIAKAINVERKSVWKKTPRRS